MPFNLLFSRDDIQSKIDQETKLKLDSMNKAVAANKDTVIADLLQRVVSEVTPQLHKNLRLDTLGSA